MTPIFQGPTLSHPQSYMNDRVIFKLCRMLPSTWQRIYELSHTHFHVPKSNVRTLRDTVYLSILLTHGKASRPYLHIHSTMSLYSSYILYPGDWVEVGHNLKSKDGTVEFGVQSDGRLILSHSGQCVFQTEQRNDIKGLKMKRDGNLCL